MKHLTFTSGLLGVAALLIGFWGFGILRSSLRAHEEADFLKDLSLIVAVVSATDWQEPWEADPAWEQLEESLGVDILPVSADESTVRQAGPLRPEWSYTATGRWRLTGLARLPTTAGSPEMAVTSLRVTREIANNDLLTHWLIFWGSMGGLLAILAYVAITSLRKMQQEQTALLEPWLAATRQNQDLKQWLPKIETESSLGPSLAILAESINCVIGTLQDENDRAELVLGNLQEGVLAIDDRSHILLANNSLHRLLGLPPEEYLDRLLLEVVRVPMINDVAQRVLGQKTPCEELVELSIPQRSLRILARPLQLGRHHSGALITIRDETIFRRIESLRRDFVANASHELKTPLAAIRAFAETLQLGALDDRPTAEHFVACIIEQADRINGLVQGMLQLSRVESGTALKIELFDARAAAEPCIAAALAMARAKSIRIHSELPSAPLQIRCDRDGFQTIISNLLSNAVRYTPDGGLVSIMLDKHDGACRLRIIDTGIGIHPNELERIFERFYRAEKDRSSETGGTGLGLSIVKHLTQALGGSVSACSQPAQGSCFEVRLPLAE